MASITKGSLKDGFRLARTVGRHLTDRENYTSQEFIEAAESAIKEHPREWIIFYMLGSEYMESGQYARALQACKRSVELRPKDLRSAYALATAYNVLTRANWSDLETAGVNVLKKMLSDPEAAGLNGLRKWLGPVPDVLDPGVSQKELDEMGMVIETAAAQAIRWFERAGDLKPDAESRTQIEEDLRTLYTRFPHLRH